MRNNLYKDSNFQTNLKERSYEKRLLFKQNIIEGFYVTSYQANFASHHTCDCHVGFLLAWRGIGKYNKMFHYFY